MGKMVGWLFVGGTLALAAADGVLIALLMAGGVAALTYASVNRTVRAPAEAIYSREEIRYRRLMLNTADAEMKKYYRECIKQLKEKKDVDMEGMSNMALGLAVATFNTPVLALGAAAYAIKSKTEPEEEVQPAMAMPVARAPQQNQIIAELADYPEGIVREGDAVVLQRPV